MACEDALVLSRLIAAGRSTAQVLGEYTRERMAPNPVGA